MTQPPEDNSVFSKLLIERVGISRSYAIELAAGQKTPSLTLAGRIEAATGIPMRFWLERPRNAETPSEAA